MVGWAESDEAILAPVGAVLAGGGIGMMLGAAPAAVQLVLGVSSGPVDVTAAGPITGSRAGLAGGGIRVVLGAPGGSVGLELF